jgi:formiminoglutamase
MISLKIYTREWANRYVSQRLGEVKLGENIGYVSELSELSKSEADFVIFGIPEDIGVRANYGKAGTATAWRNFLTAFLNVQQNNFIDPTRIILLGEINTSEALAKASNIDISDPNYHEKLGDLTARIDEVVKDTVEAIIKAGKTPIIIGGGHNNAYGNLAGTSAALDRPVNALNIDAHTDLRTPAYRHSGNGFSFALKNGFLKRYFVYGLHENYTPEYIFSDIENMEDRGFRLLEELPENDRIRPFSEAIEFVNRDAFGLELDCDAIANFPSSAFSPTGFSFEEARQLVRKVAAEKNCKYLHICEAMEAPNYPTGKALSYLTTDFMKNRKYD